MGICDREECGEEYDALKSEMEKTKLELQGWRNLAYDRQAQVERLQHMVLGMLSGIR